MVTGLGLGLASGSTCFWTCASVMGPYLVATQAEPEARRWSTVPAVARALLWYHLGRLLAYLGVAVIAAKLASRATLPPWLQASALLLTAAVLAASLLRPSDHRRCWGRRPRALGAFGVGLLQGLLPCPPFLAAIAVALASPGLPGALLLFGFLFLGTGLYSLPLLLLEPLRRGKLLRRLTLAAGVVVCLLLGGRAISLLLG
jgi:sulfite exporter TauE/SafE